LWLFRHLESQGDGQKNTQVHWWATLCDIRERRNSKKRKSETLPRQRSGPKVTSSKRKKGENNRKSISERRFNGFQANQNRGPVHQKRSGNADGVGPSAFKVWLSVESIKVVGESEGKLRRRTSSQVSKSQTVRANRNKR